MARIRKERAYETDQSFHVCQLPSRAGIIVHVTPDSWLPNQRQPSGVVPAWLERCGQPWLNLFASFQNRNAQSFQRHGAESLRTCVVLVGNVEVSSTEGNLLICGFVVLLSAVVQQELLQLHHHRT